MFQQERSRAASIGDRCLDNCQSMSKGGVIFYVYALQIRSPSKRRAFLSPITRAESGNTEQRFEDQSSGSGQKKDLRLSLVCHSFKKEVAIALCKTGRPEIIPV